MGKYDLSIIIPACKEEWLARTVQDIVENKTDRTEVIVVLDGDWADPPIADHPDVRIIYTANRGQRAATKLGARLSKAKWIAKCDAHVAFDKHFDKKLLETPGLQDNWTVVPVMKNLHVFNWRCMDCGDETYQGPTPEGCKNCDVNTPDRFEKKLIWRAKPSPNSSAFKFTPNRLQFKYFNTLKNRQQESGEKVVETMSLQGSFFMLTKERYFELDIDDESFGGWGMQGSSVAIKTWLSGGRVVCNLDTWYSHMFRTQSGFAFPWGNPAKQQQKAREIVYELFTKNQWDKQVRPLSWLIERFWDDLQKEPHREDDPKWTHQDLQVIKATENRFTPPTQKGIIYTTHNQLKLKIAHKVQDQLLKVSREKNIPIVSCTLKPIPKMGRNIVYKGKRGVETMFNQILIALENSNSEIVYFCEHDVLYHPSHFDFVPPEKDKFYYNVNWWRIREGSDITVHWDANQVSGLVCYRQLAIEWFSNKLREIQEKGFDRSYEPGGRNTDLTAQFKSEYPNIDIRGDWNQTKSKWSPDDFRDKSTCVNWQETTIGQIPGWDGVLHLGE